MPRTGSPTRRTCLALGILAFLVACVFAAHHEFLLPEHAAHAAASVPDTVDDSGTGTARSRSCDSSDGGGCLTAPTALPVPAPAPAPDVLLPPPPTPRGVHALPADTPGPSPPDLAELSILRI
ncbi:hypothetical protein GCM10009799_51900 [Nocardiopsis rhodophaea]|uniref:Lipoprotein n=1 Tax=Nocardiopsis rhodophaea TaxID=280238 RepID=A0ABP5F8K5_9ACTN